MVEQNGGKLRRLKKVIEKWRFVGIQNFFRERHYHVIIITAFFSKGNHKKGYCLSFLLEAIH